MQSSCNHDCRQFPTIWVHANLSFSITILHVFVIIVALLGGYKRSLILGLTFGIYH